MAFGLATGVDAAGGVVGVPASVPVPVPGVGSVPVPVAGVEPPVVGVVVDVDALATDVAVGADFFADVLADPLPDFGLSDTCGDPLTLPDFGLSDTCGDPLTLPDFGLADAFGDLRLRTLVSLGGGGGDERCGYKR
jgi:hypothetical protein